MADIENRVRKLESVLNEGHLKVLCRDGNGEEIITDVASMIDGQLDFIRIVSGGNLREAERVLDYIVPHSVIE